MRRAWNSLLAATCLAGGLMSLAIVNGKLPAQEPALGTEVAADSETKIPESGISVSEDAKPQDEEPRDDESGISSDSDETAKVRGDSPERSNRLPGDAVKSNLTVDDVKSAQTLDDVRKMYKAGDKVPMRAVIETRMETRVVPTRRNSVTFKPAKPILLTTGEAKRMLDQLRTRLRTEKAQPVKSNPEAEKVILDRALTSYFISDMKARVTELDKIKARVKELEVQLERRMKAKNEIIELQKKVLLSEVDGLGFFSPDDRDEENADISLDISESVEDEPSPDEAPGTQLQKF
jgi:hypothetical protein